MTNAPNVRILVRALAVLLAVMATTATLGSLASAQEDPILAEPGEVDWRTGPGSLPPGAEFVVVEGHPSEEGPFAMWLRLPAGYEIPPHLHPQVEHVTVLSGTFGLGSGERFDRDAGRTLGPGGFAAMPVGHPHFAWAETTAVVQLHSVGPWGIEYVNPDDDPRD